jgi:hypothetical protein
MILNLKISMASHSKIIDLFVNTERHHRTLLIDFSPYSRGHLLSSC